MQSLLLALLIHRESLPLQTKIAFVFIRTSSDTLDSVWIRSVKQPFTSDSVTRGSLALVAFPSVWQILP